MLHVIKLDPRAAGGIERFADELMTAQVEAGHEVRAVGCDVHPDRRASRDVPYGLTLAATWTTLFHLPLAPGFPRAIAKAIEGFRPEVVHVHWPNPLVLDLAPRIPADARLVLHWHADIDPNGASLPIRIAYALAVRRFEARLVARADAIVATSAGYAAASPVLRDAGGKLHVVPIGLRALGPTAPAAWPFAGRPRVLFIGRAVPYKSLETLLGALTGLPDATLVAVGSGPELARWRIVATGLGLDTRVTFTGSIDEERKRALIAACDVLCLPSSNRLEAFGVVLLEAAAAGRPVVAADVPGSGVAEVARTISGSATFPVADTDALTRALATYPREVTAASTLDARYEIDAVASAIEAVYATARR